MKSICFCRLRKRNASTYKVKWDYLSEEDSVMWNIIDGWEVIFVGPLRKV